MLRHLPLAAALMLSMSVALISGSRTRTVRPPDPPTPTFNKEVVRIFQQHCQSCHRPGNIAPFPLLTHSDAAPRARLIKQMTQQRHMPPWKPVDGCGKFVDSRKMSDHEIGLIARWADGGAPEGTPADLPPAREFSSAWEIGEPDVVLRTPSYTPPVQQEMYRCYSLPPATATDRYVTALDVRPGNRAAVHHVIAFLDTTGESKVLDDRDPEPGYPCFGGPGLAPTGALGGWAPGARAQQLPDGVASLLPAGARVVAQVHYHAHSASSAPDVTELGIYYSKKPVQKQLRILPLINSNFVIPAGAAEHEVTATFRIPPWVSASAITITPHMHLLGRKMKVKAILPDGRESCLIQIDDWDFNWQGTYLFENPVPLPGGTALQMSAIYDNSAGNPRNPNTPPKDVRWGEATTDEMAIAFIGFTVEP
jgi:hypothetical protein